MCVCTYFQEQIALRTERIKENSIYQLCWNWLESTVDRKESYVYVIHIYVFIYVLCVIYNYILSCLLKYMNDLYILKIDIKIKILYLIILEKNLYVYQTDNIITQ